MTSTNNGRMIFYENPASLQEIASVAIAAHAWRFEFKGERVYNTDEINRRLRSFIQDRISVCTEKMIAKSLKSMLRSFSTWYYDHLHFFNSKEEADRFLHKHYDLVSWRSWHIDYDQTAKNLITCVDLHSISKYQLACVYCFESDIRNIWRPVPKTIIMTEIDPFEFRGKYLRIHDLFNYWYFRLRTDSTPIRVPFGRSIESNIFAKMTIFNHFPTSAVLYFWTSLKPDKQVKQFARMIKITKYPEVYLRLLLPLLNEIQFETVIELLALDIMRAYTYSKNSEEALQIWYYVKNAITGEDFVRLLQYASPDFCYNIWCHAPDRLKSYFLNDDHFGEFLLKFYKLNSEEILHDVRFLTILLSHASFPFRNCFWQNHWQNLIRLRNSTELNGLIKLCLENDEAIADFKRTYLSRYSNIRKKCRFLVKHTNFDDLNKFLRFCSPDRIVFVDLKTKVVWSRVSIKYFLKCKSVRGLSSFLEFAKDVCPKVDDDINIDYDTIASFLNGEYIYYIIEKGRMNSLRKFIDSLLTREIDTNYVKSQLIKICRSVLMNAQFDTFVAKKWNKFLLWCFNDNQLRLDLFKLYLSVDAIFHILFEKSVLRFEECKAWNLSNPITEKNCDHESSEVTDIEILNVSSSNLSPLDVDMVFEDDSNTRYNESIMTMTNKEVSMDVEPVTESNDDSKVKESDSQCVGAESDCEPFGSYVLNDFLMWYFSSEEKIDEFKMKKIEKSDIFPLRDLFASGKECLIGKVLEWFFNGDNERIEIFKTSLDSSN